MQCRTSLQSWINGQNSTFFVCTLPSLGRPSDIQWLVLQCSSTSAKRSASTTCQWLSCLLVVVVAEVARIKHLSQLCCSARHQRRGASPYLVCQLVHVCSANVALCLLQVQLMGLKKVCLEALFQTPEHSGGNAVHGCHLAAGGGQSFLCPLAGPCATTARGPRQPTACCARPPALVSTTSP